ncbi:T9SS type A sorting domain-containing protein [Bacteroidota bacterium]
MKKKIIGCMLPIMVAISSYVVAQQSESVLQNIDKPIENVRGLNMQDKPNSINPNTIETDFSIYPNPNIGRFTVKVPQNTTVLKIYSASGKEIFTSFPDRYAELIPIDISELGPSVYFVLITADEIQQLLRLVVTK